MDGYDPYLVCIGAYSANAQVAGTDQTLLKWLQAYMPVSYSGLCSGCPIFDTLSLMTWTHNACLALLLEPYASTCTTSDHTPAVAEFGVIQQTMLQLAHVIM